MSDNQHRVTNETDLRAIIGAPAPGVELKVYDSLPQEAQDFIALSPFLVLSTADAQGRLDTSPKGDRPGFVHIVSDTSLVIPDRPGNRLAFGLLNILATSRVGILFVVPGTTETLRVNGRAEISNDPVLLEQLAARGKPAILALQVTVEECFFHCSKAFIRSELWKSDTWPERQRISFGAMIADRLANAESTEESNAALAAAIDSAITDDYTNNL